MHLRQGKYSEAAKSFETELKLITGDLGSDSSAGDLNSSAASNATSPSASISEGASTRNVTAVNGSTVPVPISKETVAVSAGEDIVAAAAAAVGKSAAPLPGKEKVLTAQEKAKARSLHMKLGKLYATQLLDVSAAASHYERAMDLGGDLDRDMRTFFAKNALELSASAKAKREADESQQERARGGPVTEGVLGGEKAEIGFNSTSGATLSLNSSNSSGDSSSSSNSSGSADQSRPLGTKVPVVPKPDSLAPSTPPRVTERAGFRNRWVVRSDPVEETAEAGRQDQGQGQEEAPRGMKMGGMKIGDSGGAGIADARGGQDHGGGEDGARSAGGGGGGGGESAFEAQVRQNEEFEDEDGESAPKGGQGEKSSVLSGLSSSRRGR
jgi:hypothetical protein